MLRRPPREPVYIRFLDDPPPTPPEPKKPEVPPAPPVKPREWPVGTIAFLTVLATGLLLHGGIAGHTRVKLEEPVSRVFEVSESTKVYVETFNGPIEVSRGETGQVDCQVVKRVSAVDEAAAESAIRNVLVTMTHDGEKVRVSARRGPGAESASTTTKIRVPDGATVYLRGSNGQVRVVGVEGGVDAKTSNGAINIKGASGAVALATSNGPISCEATDAVVVADSVNGPIEFRGSLAPGHSSLHTSNGRVTVKLPSSQTFRIDAKTTNGRVSTDFDLNSGRSSRGKALSGTVGDDHQAEMKVRTSNGGIRIVEVDD
jgi:DUF4097 and DUF4098 domain-containing protein YvlB